MRTTTQDPSTHLRSVQELLFELDKMKNTGLGARERLDFILDGGASLVDEFDFADAFDVELRAANRRLEGLNDMGATLRHSQTQWKNGPVREEVKEAAGRLLEHLDGFLKIATTRERKTEIEMLSSLWEYSPDLSHMYSWLSSWKPKSVPKQMLPELEEFAKKKAELYEELDARALKEAEEAHDLELKKMEMAPAVKDLPKKEPTVEEPPKKFPLMTEGRSVEMQNTGRISTRIVTVSVPPGSSAPGHEPTEEPNLIRRESWTSALREMTTDEWAFRRESTDTGFGPEGRVASVLLWHANQCETRLELTELADDEIKVGLRILLRGTLRTRTETMLLDEAIKLHLDPIAFVKKTLEA